MSPRTPIIFHSALTTTQKWRETTQSNVKVTRLIRTVRQKPGSDTSVFPFVTPHDICVRYTYDRVMFSYLHLHASEQS